MIFKIKAIIPIIILCNVIDSKGNVKQGAEHNIEKNELLH